jgi:hypothetical protein
MDGNLTRSSTLEPIARLASGPSRRSHRSEFVNSETSLFLALSKCLITFDSSGRKKSFCRTDLQNLFHEQIKIAELGSMIDDRYSKRIAVVYGCPGRHSQPGLLESQKQLLVKFVQPFPLENGSKLH